MYQNIDEESNHWYDAGVKDAQRDAKLYPDREVKKLNPRTRLKTMQDKQARHPEEVEQYSLGYRSGKQGVAEEMQHKKITELFDARTAFPLKWDNQFASIGEIHAEAHDAAGRVIDIAFTPIGNGRGIEIVFQRGSSYDLTSQGDASRVLATVVNAISMYLQKHQPPYIAFSAKSTGGRAGAYAAMIRRLARGYTLLTPDEYPEDTEGFLDFLGRDIPFILARNAKMDTKGVAEDAAGVGVIAKNKKMARDPRYSMSITKDVQPGQDKKNLQAWHLIKK
jgi:hypothetical protein